MEEGTYNFEKKTGKCNMNVSQLTFTSRFPKFTIASPEGQDTIAVAGGAGVMMTEPLPAFGDPLFALL